MENVIAEKIRVARVDSELTNMWWPHTRNDSSAIETDEYAIIR